MKATKETKPTKKRARRFPASPPVFPLSRRELHLFRLAAASVILAGLSVAAKCVLDLLEALR